uniref:Uncharacterized protein n=1 Tax=Anguilla anguilla TaxID=7936 RepID=A0A0E9SZM1_ANGAN
MSAEMFWMQNMVNTSEGVFIYSPLRNTMRNHLLIHIEKIKNEKIVNDWISPCLSNADDVIKHHHNH